MYTCPICKSETRHSSFSESSWVGVVEEHMICECCKSFEYNYAYGATDMHIGRLMFVPIKDNKMICVIFRNKKKEIVIEHFVDQIYQINITYERLKWRLFKR